MADVVALLPMKGHSERVPGKNLRPLAGRPLYHWILDTLLSVPSIATVVVDTDSEAIADDAGLFVSQRRGEAAA
jgi:CMP-N-acetylneuraminic acid synthetase